MRLPLTLMISTQQSTVLATTGICVITKSACSTVALQATITGGVSGARKLLENIAKLPQLATLHLIDTQNMPCCTPEDFAALTASSALEDLSLDFVNEYPWHSSNTFSWQPAFHSTKQLSQVGHRLQYHT
jgi:hypothetical protein